MPSPPDYYAVLGTSSRASDAEIKTAYKKASLKTHPDRLPANATDRQRREATERFQQVADAYYVLSDPTRRASYDRLRPASSGMGGGAGPSVPGGFDASSAFESFSSFFRGAEGFEHAPSSSGDAEPVRPDADTTFGDVFEDLLRPEVERTVPVWKWTGALAGAALGFIAGNLPGAAIGGYGGSRLGHLRDIKGRAVIDVFRDLAPGDRASILKALALKVLGTAATTLN